MFIVEQKCQPSSSDLCCGEQVALKYIGVVDIFNKTCTYKEFNIDKLSCVHAIAAVHNAHVSVYSLVSPYYTNEYYVLAYSETIYSTNCNHNGMFPTKSSQG